MLRKIIKNTKYFCPSLSFLSEYKGKREIRLGGQRMDAGYTMEEAADLARKCILLGNETRPELEWMKKRYERIQEKYNLKNKTETE